VGLLAGLILWLLNNAIPKVTAASQASDRRHECLARARGGLGVPVRASLQELRVCKKSAAICKLENRRKPLGLPSLHGRGLHLCKKVVQRGRAAEKQKNRGQKNGGSGFAWRQRRSFGALRKLLWVIVFWKSLLQNLRGLRKFGGITK